MTRGGDGGGRPGLFERAKAYWTAFLHALLGSREPSHLDTLGRVGQFMEGTTSDLNLEKGFGWLAILNLESQMHRGVVFETGRPNTGPRVSVSIEPNRELRFTIVGRKGDEHFVRLDYSEFVGVWCAVLCELAAVGKGRFRASISINFRERAHEAFAADLKGRIAALSTIGTDLTRKHFAKFEMAEMMQFTIPVPNPDRQEMWAYLRDRYALSDA